MAQIPERFRVGNTELLRRFEYATAHPPLAKISLKEHEELFHLTSRTKTFEELPQRLRDLIEESERNAVTQSSRR